MTEDWDARYASRAAGLWSGRANGSLVAEVAGLEPGRALDIGCGEGADAIWLATQGWDVTAIDVSAVAIGRAAAAAEEAGVSVHWLVGDLTEAAPTGFDLVSLHYPALPHTALPAILGAVAPGGTLLVVGHADVDPEWARSRGFDPADYLQPEDIQAQLEGWTVEASERRERVNVPEGAHHHHDFVLRARR